MDDRDALHEMTDELMAALTALVLDLRGPLPQALVGRRVGFGPWRSERGRGFSTRAIHEAKTPPIDQETPSVPIYQTSTFRFADSDEYAETISFRKPGYTYTRGYGNPTLGAFEALMANLEGTEAAFSFSSGMAAMHAVFTTLAASGDRIVVQQRAVRRRLLALHEGHAAVRRRRSTWWIRTTWTRSPPRFPGAAFFYVETIANPNVTVADLEALGALCRAQRRAGRRRQHVRVAVPGQPVALGVRVRRALRDEVHRRAQRPDRRRRVHVAWTAARRSATPRSTPAARWRRSRRGSACAAS